jgi:hypothetical protein
MTYFTVAVQVAVATAAEGGVSGVEANVVAVMPTTFALGGGAGFHLDG